MGRKHQAVEESLVKEEKKKNNHSFSRILNSMFFTKKNCKFPTLNVWLEICNIFTT